MARSTVFKNNFSAGELSPRLDGRTDIAKYQNGCEKLENFITLVAGGVAKRTGTRFIHQTRNNDTTGLIPFRYSPSEAFVIEMSPTHFRFYTQEGIVVTAEGSTTPYEITHPLGGYGDITYVQSGNTLIFCTKSFRPVKLMRFGLADWRLSGLGFNYGPYLRTQTVYYGDSRSGATIQLEVASGPSIITASAPIFKENRLLKIKQTHYYITAIESGTRASVVPLSAVVDIVAATPYSDWRLGAWYDGVNGSQSEWPHAVCFYEERLWFAATTYQPQTIWATETGDFYGHNEMNQLGEVNDSNALVYTIGSDDNNDIRYLIPGKILSIFTDTGEFIASASSLNEAMTPRNRRIARETNRGTSDIRPTVIDKEVLFWQRARKTLREYIYDVNVDGYKSVDLTVLADHIAGDGVVASGYQQEPGSVLWSVREDGVLLGLTYNREQEVVGWHRHIIGGDDAKVHDIACIPNANGYDELWLIVSRSGAGGRVYTVETLTQELRFYNPEDQSNAIYLDGSLSYTGDPRLTFSGMTHAAGGKVAVVVDGSRRNDALVAADGTFTIDTPGRVVHAGFPYEAVLVPTRQEGGGNDGTSQTKTGRVHKLGIRMLNTVGIKYGATLQKLRSLNVRKNRDPMGTATPLFTGDVVVEFDGANDTRRQVIVVSEGGYPCTILGVAPADVIYG